MSVDLTQGHTTLWWQSQNWNCSYDPALHPNGPGLAGANVTDQGPSASNTQMQTSHQWFSYCLPWRTPPGSGSEQRTCLHNLNDHLSLHIGHPGSSLFSLWRSRPFSPSASVPPHLAVSLASELRLFQSEDVTCSSSGAFIHPCVQPKTRRQS